MIKELFKVFDKDSNGGITSTELKMGLRCINGTNPTKTEIRQIMMEMGVTKGRSITYEQFENCLMTYLQNCTTDSSRVEETLRSSFSVFDKDNSGFIDKAELRKALTTLGENLKDNEVDEMFKAADINGDGKVEYKEFITMFSSDKKANGKK